MTIVAAFLLFYSLFAGRFELRLINGPMMFLLAGFILGTGFLNVLSPSIAGQGFRLLAELTLAIVLFTDAANANLAPTDAALGKAVVSNPAVPAPTREALNVESGLNDGICVPVLFLFLTLLVPDQEQVGTLALSLHLIVEEIGIGVVTAVVLALLTTRLITLTDSHGWRLPMWRQLTLPVLSFTAAQWLGGSGFTVTDCLAAVWRSGHHQSVALHELAHLGLCRGQFHVVANATCPDQPDRHLDVMGAAPVYRLVRTARTGQHRVYRDCVAIPARPQK